MLSIIIPVRDRPIVLKRCIESIVCQKKINCVEIIIVDDGSTISYHDLLKSLENRATITYVKQVPLGIAAARNRGILIARYKWILFIDSDCVMGDDCLENLIAKIQTHPKENCFQLNIHGSLTYPAGIIEHVRVQATIEQLIKDNKTIKYVNTAGFLIEKNVLSAMDNFNVSLVRGTDTFLLSRLLQEGFVPGYLVSCIINHMPEKTLADYILNHFSIGFHNSNARQFIAGSSKVLMNNRQRMSVLKRISDRIKKARLPSVYIPLQLIAYSIESIGRFVFKIMKPPSVRFSSLSVIIDPISENEIIARITEAALLRKNLFVTYLTAWSLVQMQHDAEFKEILNHADICAPDGMGVVLTAFFTKLKLVKKVTIHDYYKKLFIEISNRKLRIALIGGYIGFPEKAAAAIRQFAPDIDICLVHPGFFDNKKQEEVLRNNLIAMKPAIIILSMSQPVQEKWAYDNKYFFQGTVMLCVGAFFEFISGYNSPLPERFRFIRRMGLEWLWRLMHDPKRHWRRYMIGIPKLGYYILCYYVSLIKNIITIDLLKFVLSTAPTLLMRLREPLKISLPSKKGPSKKS